MSAGNSFSWRGCLGIVIVLTVLGAVIDGMQDCSVGRSHGKFEKKLEEGDLTGAKAVLKKGDVDKDAALQLIEVYLAAGDADAAIDVYENVTSDHASRYEMRWKGSYSREACKLLREYLVQHGQYEKAWNYYPLEYEDENYSGNAKCRYEWMSDVVSEMCKKGHQDDARIFVDDQIRWFVTCVDGDTRADSEATKAAYGSEVVREKLYNQIDNVH